MLTHQAVFTQSMNWIRANPLATTHDVPDQLARTWIAELEDQTAPTGIHLSIFTFGYCQRQLLERGAAPGQKLTIPAETLIELFQLWQLKLGLIEVHRKTDLRVGPMALFSFPDDESIEYWRSSAN